MQCYRESSQDLDDEEGEEDEECEEDKEYEEDKEDEEDEQEDKEDKEDEEDEEEEDPIILEEAQPQAEPSNEAPAQVMDLPYPWWFPLVQPGPNQALSALLLAKYLQLLEHNR